MQKHAAKRILHASRDIQARPRQHGANAGATYYRSMGLALAIAFSAVAWAGIALAAKYIFTLAGH